MGQLYINENGAHVSITANRIVIRYNDGMEKSLPIETLDGITILGKVQVTTQCVEKLLSKGIPVAYFSKGGRYFGRLVSPNHIKVKIQRIQSSLYDTPFALEFARNIIDAKLRNQSVVLRRYARNHSINIKEEVSYISFCLSKVRNAKSITEINGYEGLAAKMYFKGLAMCIDEEFSFSGRNRQPPKDPFNSLLSLGYSILMNEIYGELECKGLNPYFGFMHRDADNHPTLVSDLLEEWRATIVDSSVMSLINGHEIKKNMFYYEDDGGCYIDKNGLNIFLNKLEKKIMTSFRYLYRVDYDVNFRRAIALQTDRLIKAIEQKDASQYEPVIIRQYVMTSSL